MKPATIIADAYAAAERIFTKQLETEVARLQTPDPNWSNSRTEEWFTRERALLGWVIADAIESYASNMVDHYKKQLEAHGILARADKVDPGQEATVYEGSLVNLVVKVGNPSVSVDKEKMSARLAAIHNFAPSEVEQFMTAVTKTSAPRKSFRLVPRAGV